jgi:hypothetical protein
MWRLLAPSVLTLFLVRRFFASWWWWRAIRSSETSVLTRATRRHIPEYGIFHAFMPFELTGEAVAILIWLIAVTVILCSDIREVRLSNLGHFTANSSISLGSSQYLHANYAIRCSTGQDIHFTNNKVVSPFSMGIRWWRAMIRISNL